MKKWLYLLGSLTALGILTRLPHPARDIAKLEPVQVVYLYIDRGTLCIETDTEDFGSGRDLTEAAEDMKARAGREIFLGTAEYLILDPAVELTQSFYTLLRPGCEVCFTDVPPDLSAAADYLAVHSPETTLAHLRAQYIPCS